jgi:hypothetical protein
MSLRSVVTGRGIDHLTAKSGEVKSAPRGFALRSQSNPHEHGIHLLQKQREIAKSIERAA